MESHDTNTGGSRLKSDYRYWLLFLSAVFTGLFFRLNQLKDQILVDDEWHAVHRLIKSDLMGILTDLGSTDHCIPLTLFYEVMANLTGLSEFFMRMPSVLAGLLALLVIPFWLGQLYNRTAGLYMAWLVAVSPLHIYYSRLARPYAITMILTFIAVLSFYKWWKGESKGWAFAYLSAGVFALYFHLSALPVVLGVFGFAAGEVVFFANRGFQALLRLLRLAAILVVALGLLLIFPLLANFGSLSRKISAGTLGWESITGAVQLLFGTTSFFLMILILLSVGFGALMTVQKKRNLSLFLIFLTLVHFSFLALVRPAVIHQPIVLARYSLVLLPFILFWAASTFSEFDGYIRRFFSSLKYFTLIPIVLILILMGPLPKIYYWPNNWINQALFQFNYDQDQVFERYRPNYISPFYSELQNYPAGEISILEAPWYFNSHVYPYYQRLHRQHTLIGFVSGPQNLRRGEIPFGDRRFRFRNFIHVRDHEQIRLRAIKYVLFHKNLMDEMPMFFKQKEIDLSRWLNEYRQRYGGPVFEDDYLIVFEIQ